MPHMIGEPLPTSIDLRSVPTPISATDLLRRIQRKHRASRCSGASGIDDCGRILAIENVKKAQRDSQRNFAANVVGRCEWNGLLAMNIA